MVQAALHEHNDAERGARADLWQTTVDVAHHEQGLVTANKGNFSPARAREIDVDSGRLMQLLRRPTRRGGKAARCEG